MYLHSEYENAFYMCKPERERFMALKVVNIDILALALGLNRITLFKKLDGIYPFTTQQFATLCEYASVTPREILIGASGKVDVKGTRQVKSSGRKPGQVA